MKYQAERTKVAPSPTPPLSSFCRHNGRTEDTRPTEGGPNHTVKGAAAPQRIWSLPGGLLSSRTPRPKPKRPRSAFDLFLSRERERILAGETETAGSLLDQIIKNKGQLSASSGGDDSSPESSLKLSGAEEGPLLHAERPLNEKIELRDLAVVVSKRWKALDESSRAIYEGMAMLEKKRYERESRTQERGGVVEAKRLLVKQKKKDRAEARKKTRAAGLQRPPTIDRTLTNEESTGSGVQPVKEVKAQQESTRKRQEFPVDKGQGVFSFSRAGWSNLCEPKFSRNTALIGATGISSYLPLTHLSPQQSLQQHILAKANAENSLSTEQTGNSATSPHFHSKPCSFDFFKAFQVTDGPTPDSFLAPPQQDSLSEDMPWQVSKVTSSALSISQGEMKSQNDCEHDFFMGEPSALLFELDRTTVQSYPVHPPWTKGTPESPTKKQRTGEPPQSKPLQDLSRPRSHDNLLAHGKDPRVATPTMTTEAELLKRSDTHPHHEELDKLLSSEQSSVIVPPLLPLPKSLPPSQPLADHHSLLRQLRCRPVRSSHHQPKIQSPFSELPGREVSTHILSSVAQTRHSVKGIDLDNDSVDFLISLFTSN